MPLTEADLGNPKLMLALLEWVKVKQALEQETSSLESPEADRVAVHQEGFCGVVGCDTCAPYLKQAQEQYKLAQVAGRNDVLTKLDQAAHDVGYVEPMEVVAARMAQMEAGEGDAAAQTLIIKALGGVS